MSAYLMVSLHAQVLNNTSDQAANEFLDPIVQKFQEHEEWDKGQGWKNLLNNLRLVIQHAYQFNETLANRISTFVFINWLFNTNNCPDKSPASAIPNTQ